MLEALPPRAVEIVRRYQDASTEPHPPAGSRQVLDLGVSVSRSDGFGCGEDAVAAISRSSQEWMHRRSVVVRAVPA
jgi:hypothetical protein